MLFLPPGCLKKQNLAGKLMTFDDDCSFEIGHHFLLNKFVLCFLTHPLECFRALMNSATMNWSSPICTTDHARLNQK